MQDFAQGKTGWMGETLQPTLAPHYRGVGAAGRGRQCSLRCRVSRGGLRVGKRRPEVVLMGERRPPFHLCLGSLSQVRCSGAASGSLHSCSPHPSLPGHRAGITGHREPGHRLGAARLSAGARLRPGKSSGELRRLLSAPGEKLCPGTWDAGLAGRPAGGGLRSQGARTRWERVWRGLCAPRLG